ncbi:hypothetical protein [Sphingomonas solaris]|uniref:Uncharacterized protein n=1 Tax=Alterirhizorhabdus solaris TaxID=2529389 RepID=A0A558R537_9SPHN|nr:hypothetical protein [Sphingomonas solaris]TVV74452.1 hypothetical protein FOY91_09735 [Sphingomonas solaris]
MSAGIECGNIGREQRQSRGAGAQLHATERATDERGRINVEAAGGDGGAGGKRDHPADQTGPQLIVTHAGLLDSDGAPTIMAAAFDKWWRAAIRDIDELLTAYRAARVIVGDVLQEQRIVSWYVAAGVLAQIAPNMVAEILIVRAERLFGNAQSRGW